MEAQRERLLYHGGPCDLPNNRPTGAGSYYFGDKSFFSGLAGCFGPCIYVYAVPSMVSNRILEIGIDQPPTKFLNAALTTALSRSFWATWKPNIPENWDEDALEEYFSELVTNKDASGIVDVIRQFDLYGINFMGEYILLQDGIDKLQFQKKLRATRQQMSRWGQSIP
jgi:hypothetical protein